MIATDEKVEAFKQRWLGSEASERSNSQLFLTELTDLMGVPHPGAARNDARLDRYVFERRVRLAHPGGDRAGFIDLFKQGCFVLESKQGANEHKKGGFAKRDTPTWENEMEKARGQAMGYAQTLDEIPPFIIVCDVGHVFEVHASFDGTAHWTAFPAPPGNRIYLRDLDHDKLALLKAIWTDPLALDPSRHQAQVSRDVAETLAALARSLEGAGHRSEAVARFLMRCIFTMFAEDVGLFPERRKLFQEYLEQYWVKDPRGFPGGVQAFWSTMNTGGMLPTGVALKQFNGGLFTDPTGLPLTDWEVAALLDAAKHAWSQVAPAIFGTLLERALDPKERHRLGAHYTPRAYVERLVRPTIEEPLRADWLVAQADARRLREAGKARDAAKVLQQFHRQLCETRVLDPACGSGNFLYVALDLMKQLEAEVREELWRLGDQNELLEFDGTTVRPSQFLGIEKKRWAKEIAELVLWIGYLRWHFRAKGDRGEVQVPEPVLENYENIECRDAVLDWDGAPDIHPARDDDGQPIARWDGETTKHDPVTGIEVPDETATVVVYEYPNARRAEWPDADFVVGNPPFIGGWRMRSALGDGYVAALWKLHPDLPEKADYVTYWWDRAAELVRTGRARRFGLITTNSITQVFQRRVLAKHIDREDAPLRLVFAIADHPWVDEQAAAAVRIAMSVGTLESSVAAVLGEVVSEQTSPDAPPELSLVERVVPFIGPTLTGRVARPDLAGALQANQGIVSPGVQLYGSGFIVDGARADALGGPGGPGHVIRPYVNGSDLMRVSRKVFVIDFCGLSEDEARAENPDAFQHVLLNVKPERDQNRREAIRTKWWRFGWERPGLRDMLAQLKRYIATPETAKHRVFVFLDVAVLPDNMVTAIASDDAFTLGVLSSHIHVVWALAAGGRLGVGNDPRYNKTRCFDPFPFPDATEAQRSRIRDLAERLDAHRKRQLGAHPRLTITNMYNVLEKLRSSTELTDRERVVHEQGLVSLLRQLHDQLDAAVADAYGWSPDLNDEELLERVVALNGERLAEESSGLVRWLRPEFQAPKATKPTQVEVPGMAPAPTATTPRKSGKWPKAFPERVALVRDVVLASASDATFSAGEVASHFKRAKTADIEAILDTFVALGRLVAFSDPDGHRRWARPTRVA